MAPPSRNGKIRCPTYPSTSNTSSYFHSTTISSAVNKISFRIFRIFSLFSSIQFLPLFNILSNPLFLSCSNPFQQLNNRQIQKCQSIYSHQLCHRQCLHFEHFLKCWDHQYSCNQKPAKYKCSDQINVIPESFRKNDRFVCFTVKSVNQTAAAKCSKCHRTCQHCISIAISDHKCCHGHDSDTQTFHSDACKKWFCQNGLSHGTRFFFHHFRIVRLQSKCDRRQAVCQKVDEQQMYRCKWNRQTCK